MEIPVQTKSRCEAVDITESVRASCRTWGGTGLLSIHCPHTTAGLTVNEHADPDVMRDILAWLARAVPEGARYAHVEGNADAHVKSLLTGCHLVLPVERGLLRLGRWQGVFFMEFDGPRRRTLWLSFLRAEETG